MFAPDVSVVCGLVLTTLTSMVGRQPTRVICAMAATSPVSVAPDAALRLAMLTVAAVAAAVNVPCTSVQVSDIVSLLLRGAVKVALAAPNVVPLTCSAKFGKVGDAVVGRVALDM